MIAETKPSANDEFAALALYGEHIEGTLGNPAWVARVNAEGTEPPLEVLTPQAVERVIEALWPLVRDTWVAKVRAR